METIKNYLETMFQNLPNTYEVQKAKRELEQMMEDKYSELKAEGKSENEAIGIVISEFGNLDEIAEDLGISGYINEDTYSVRRQVTLEEVKEFCKDKARSGYMTSLGVLLCITSPGGVMLLQDEMGVVLLLIMVAIAVGLFIFSEGVMGKWDFLKKQACSVDFATTDYVHNQREAFRTTNVLLNTIGVALCILSVIPVIMLGDYGDGSMGIVLLLLMVGLAVFLFIMAEEKSTAYKTILKLNDAKTMGGAFVDSQKEVRYSNKIVAAIMSVYWPTITCIYLCWSFLTMDWHFTWIIWVVAGIVETFIKNVFRE